jgi:hypothetical protein
MNPRRALFIGAGLLSIPAPIPSAHSAEGVARRACHDHPVLYGSEWVDLCRGDRGQVCSGRWRV